MRVVPFSIAALILALPLGAIASITLSSSERGICVGS